MDRISNALFEHSAQPSKATEQAIAAIWAQELGVGTIEGDSDFFALGGDSLNMLTVLFRITQALGVEVAPEALYVHPTLSAFSHVVEDMLGDAAVASGMESGTI